MSVSMAIFTFLNCWAISLFLVLPFAMKYGVHTRSDDYVAAPKHIAWKKIVIMNTILSVVITATIAIIIKTGIVPVR